MGYKRAYLIFDMTTFDDGVTEVLRLIMLASRLLLTARSYHTNASWQPLTGGALSRGCCCAVATKTQFSSRSVRYPYNCWNPSWVFTVPRDKARRTKSVHKWPGYKTYDAHSGGYMNPFCFLIDGIPQISVGLHSRVWGNSREGWK